MQTELPNLQHKLGGSSGASGTIYVDGRIYVPNFEARNNERIVIRDGGVIETWGTKAGVYTFLQNSTIDVQKGGRLLLLGNTCYAQAAKNTNTISVAEGAFLDLRTTTSSGARMANNGVSRIFVDGGVAYWATGNSGGLTENGRAEVRVQDGGHLVVCGRNGVVGEFLAAVTSSRTTIAYPEGSEILLASGGEFVTTQIRNSPNLETYLDVPVKFLFDGGVLSCAGNGDLFNFTLKATAAKNQLRVVVRGGGAVVDTREGTGTLNWNAVAIQGTDVEGGADGVFEKRGAGAFKLSAAYQSTGTFRVKAGSLVIADAANFSGKPLELRPRAKVSFSGTTLALSALTAKDGVICLTSGQTVSVASAPVVEGSLVFDVATGVDGSFTLLTGTGIDDALAAKCRVLTPTVGKSATFAAVDGALVLTVADGTAPDAPVLAASEDARTFFASGEATLDDVALAGETTYLAGGASVTYSGEGATLNDANFGAFGSSQSTLVIGAGAGDVTFDGSPDLSLATVEAAPVVRLSSSGGGKFVFKGDWSASLPWTPAWFGFVFGTGSYAFDADFSLGASLALDFAKGQSFTFSAAALDIEAATDATGATKAAPGEATMVTLDGSVVRAAEGGDGSFNDFFAGATGLALGAKGAAFDTLGHDVTVTQTLLASPAGASAAAGFEKRGAGTLTLGSGINVIYGPLKVTEGTLKAGFATGMRKAYPSGALAIWDFDGDDPYADKSGHGYRLAQSHPDGRQVGFTDENAYLGSAAIFTNASISASDGGSLCNADITSSAFLRQTVCARVRLARYDTNSGIVSTRSKSDFSSCPGSFDLAYKTVWNTNGVSVASGVKGFGTIWASAAASVWDHQVGHQPALNEWHHLVMIQDNGVYTSYLDGVRYVDGYAKNPSQFVVSGCLITIGQGTHAGEFMHDGGMIDEVIVYPRALAADEVQALYEGTAASASFAATVSAGATWNLDGTAPTVKSLSGDGSIVNGTLSVTDAITVGEGHSLSVAKLVIPTAEGTLDFGFGTERKIRSGETVSVMSVGEIDAESLANLGRWTLTGLGANGDGRRVELFAEGGVLKATVYGRGALFIIR